MSDEEVGILERMRLNRYMVECKLKEIPDKFFELASLNRYMVECKCCQA